MSEVWRFAPPGMAPDFGEYNEGAWLAVTNALPIGLQSWVLPGRCERRVALSATASNPPLGCCVHPGHGTNGWTVYYGTATKLYAVEPATWTETDRSGAAYTANAAEGWYLIPFRNHVIATGGITQAPQIRLDGAGNFEDLIEHKEPTSLAIIKGWQEDASGAPDYVDLTSSLNDSSTGTTAQPFPTGSGINDAIYFGLPAAATALRIEVETAGAGTYTVAWEFWNGTAWTALSGLTDPSSGFKTVGVHVLKYTFPTTWEETSVNGSIYLFYLRARRDGGTVTTNPLLSEADPVTGNWPPKPKFGAVWGNRFAIASIEGSGPATKRNQIANSGSAPDPATITSDDYLIWVSADDNPRRYGVPLDPNHAGENSNYYYLADSHGPITAFSGSADFGAVFKPRASYLALWDSPLGVEFRQRGANVGCIWPQSLIWVDQELYFWSTGGPARMTLQGGVEVLTKGVLQRTIFDDTWISDSFPIEADRNTPRRLWATYSQVTDTVFWHYRHDYIADEDDKPPNVAVVFHRPTGRFSIIEYQTLVDGLNLGGALYSVFVNPYPEDLRHSGTKDLVYVSQTGEVEDIVSAQVEDNSAGTYADVTAETNSDPGDFKPLPALGGANDAYYLGFDWMPTSPLTVIVAVAGAGGFTVTWEYWNGAWTALAGVTDSTLAFQAVPGTYSVVYTDPTDAQKTTVNSVGPLYWIRCRVATGAVSTDPQLTQVQQTKHLAIYEVDPAGTAYWKHFPTWLSPYIGPARNTGNVPAETIVRWVRPIVGLNAGSAGSPLAAPQVVVSVNSRRQTLLSLPTASSNTTVLDDYGCARIPDSIPALYHQIRVELGGSSVVANLDNDLANVENVATFDGIELGIEKGAMVP